jgi:hypothetical protein
LNCTSKQAWLETSGAPEETEAAEKEETEVRQHFTDLYPKTCENLSK